MKRALIVVAKRPEPGRTKTRLCPPLSEEQASALYECFLKDTLAVAHALVGAERFLAFTPSDQMDYFRPLAPDFGLLPQVGHNLGERLDNALTCCLAGGFDRAVIASSDSPTLTAGHLAAAFEALDEADVVLGPCSDGGYYLIGLRRPNPSLLRGVRMSTHEVLRDTVALAEAGGLSVALTPLLYDIDCLDDLRRLWVDLAESPPGIAEHTRAFLRTLKLKAAGPGFW